MPKVSIITINYNNLSGLQKTMQSVFAQTFTDYEYIIIDGGSTDSSKEYIEKFADKLVYWVSEKDKGVYNAQNKGIKKSKGEYLLFLNSGDKLIDSTILDKVFSVSPDVDIMYGDLEIVENDKTYIKYYPAKVSFSYLFTDTLPHPASFIKKTLFDKAGYYSERYSIISDWAFFVDAFCKYGATYAHISKVISVFYRDGISSLESNSSLIFQERQDFLRKNYSAFFNDYTRFFSIEKKLKLIEVSRMYKISKKIRTIIKGNR